MPCTIPVILIMRPKGIPYRKIDTVTLAAICLLAVVRRHAYHNPAGAAVACVRRCRRRAAGTVVRLVRCLRLNCFVAFKNR